MPEDVTSSQTPSLNTSFAAVQNVAFHKVFSDTDRILTFDFGLSVRLYQL